MSIKLDTGRGFGTGRVECGTGWWVASQQPGSEEVAA